MAKLISGFDITVDFSVDYKEYEKQIQVGIEQCRNSLASDSTGDTVGKVIRFQIADAHMRGLNLSDIRKMIKGEEVLTRMFS